MTPKSIGHYEIKHVLGEGGIGRVYAALDTELDRMVAIKALKPEVGGDASFVERFRGEAASLARLSHPNITTLFALHRQGRDLFMVMELVDGYTLEDVLAQLRRLGTRESLAIIAQTAAGLSYAHGMGVIHRDIKPANLMLTKSGLLKIMDFGIARVRGSRRMTRAGSIIGTLAYVAPEQIRGEDGSEQTDLYSLACVLYEMLSGNPPFIAESEYELIRAQVEALPRPLEGQIPGLDTAVGQVVLQGLAKSPDERPQGIAAFSRALGATAIQGESVEIVRDRVLAQISRMPAPATRYIDTTPVAKGRRAAMGPGLGRGGEGRTDGAVDTGERSRALPTIVLGGVAAALLLVLVVMVVDPFGSGPGSDATRPGNQTTTFVPGPTAQPSSGPAPSLPTHEARIPSPTLPLSSTMASSPDAGAPGTPPVVATSDHGPVGQAAPGLPPSSTIFPNPDDGAPGAPQGLPQTLPPSSTILDTGAPGNTPQPVVPSTLPARRPPDLPRYPETISGMVTGNDSDGWPIIDGHPVRLVAVETIPSGMVAGFVQWLTSQGSQLDCKLMSPAGGYRCRTANGVDVSQTVLLNGGARAAADAAKLYRDAEQKARDLHRGIWR